MPDRIFVTEADFQRLSRLIRRRRPATSSEAAYLDTLEQELDRADIVDPAVIAADVVTMDSEVRLKDLDTGEVKDYRLVFPGESRGDNCVSILAPIGTALLGYRVGDVIEWPVPKGIRRLQVLEVLRQPDFAAAGDC